MYISCRMRIPDLFYIYCRGKSPALADERFERRHEQKASSKSTQSFLSLPIPQPPPTPKPPSSHHPPAKSYLVSLGPPQRKEAGEEELAPADDSSQAPVEASHACVCPVLSASLLSPRLGSGTGSCNPPRRKNDVKQKQKDPVETGDLLVLAREAEMN